MNFEDRNIYFPFFHHHGIVAQIFYILCVYQNYELSIEQIRKGLGLISHHSAAAGVGNLFHKKYVNRIQKGENKYWQINKSTSLDSNGNYCYQPNKNYPPQIITQSQIKAIRDRAYDPEYRKMFDF